MARSTCKFVSIVYVILALVLVGSDARASGLLLKEMEVTHYTESSWLPQIGDVVVTSKLTLDALRLGPVHGYAGAVLEQDSRSDRQFIYNDNGISPMLGARMALLIPEVQVFSEYRQTFRMVNRPDSRSSSQPDLLLGTYGYKYWSLAGLSESASLFQEAYGDMIARSKLSFDPILGSWSKTGARLKLGGPVSVDSFLDIQFRRASTGEPEDNYQTLGPGLRLNLTARTISAALSAHEELGSYTQRSDSISRWKTLLVISGAL